MLIVAASARGELSPLLSGVQFGPRVSATSLSMAPRSTSVSASFRNICSSLLSTVLIGHSARHAQQLPDGCDAKPCPATALCGARPPSSVQPSGLRGSSSVTSVAGHPATMGPVEAPGSQGRGGTHQPCFLSGTLITLM
ncbi:hypothetical protein C8Q78DRAFT_655636 [Trametes maxima]|nr:hypothetical protein C8Q78DRAFT_655636 [Trametes maxima]